ncbi:putative glutamine amidotransferase-like protein [Tolypocladium ophioglossoides CBS 100239]|uniref:Putative glutamine amidotransferase-like protein n=1 Tax=Tolypocladium ophioglossoides (strain CBS 100239) TaxID=1163406 RepID=A0A0L0MYS0_TOLOC|nr:putative glutamine amidotransferase-like protein [Tolypocladium ophioglossoides CBS 100239]
MAASPFIIRIAMLNADTPVPNVLAKVGSYGNLFHGLLKAAAKHVAPNLAIESEDFDVVRGEYPRSASDFDALLITGSAASSYDDSEWNHKLDEYLLSVYETCPRVKIFGSCFGHQIVCQSILRKYGVIIEKDPKGWELGVHEIQLNEAFLEALGPGFCSANREPTPETANDPQPPSPKTLRLQFIHADHVKIPEGKSLPSPWLLMGWTKHCAVQGVYEPGRVLTYQGHFEFDRFINTKTLEVFGAKWDTKALQSGLEAMDKDDDSKEAARMVVRFLLEGRSVVYGGDGLMTPP